MLSTSILGQTPSVPPQGPAGQQPSRSFSGGNGNRVPQTPNQGHQRPVPPNFGQQNRPQPGPPSRTTTPNNASGPPRPPGLQAGNVPETVGFFSARAVNQLPETSIQGTTNARIAAPQGQQAFNPKAESPSIRKTPGIDHSSSKPVARNGQHIPPAASQAPTAAHGNTGSFTPVRPSGGGSQAGRGNMVNPSLDHTRRIGAPMGPGSPLSNRGSYRPPTMKRPPPGDANSGRPPLADLPANGNGPPAVSGESGLEAKRQKMA